MAYQRTQAQKLLTALELALFDAGRTTEIKSLSKSQLRSKLERSRKLRDKYRDLHRRQRVALRGKPGSKSGTQDTANLRTQQKEEILAESVVRFETRLAQIEKEEDRDFAKFESAAAKSARAGATKTAGRAKSVTAVKKTARTSAAKRTATAKSATASGAKSATKTATKSSTKAASKAATKTAAKKSPSAAKRTTATKKSSAKTAVKTSGAKTTPSTLLAKKKAVAKKASAKKAPSKSAKAPAANPLDLATQKGNVSAQARAVGKGAAGQSSRALSIGAHQRGQTRRSQAKRDS